MQGRPICHTLPVMRVDLVSVPDTHSNFNFELWDSTCTPGKGNCNSLRGALGPCSSLFMGIHCLQWPASFHFTFINNAEHQRYKIITKKIGTLGLRTENCHTHNAKQHVAEDGKFTSWRVASCVLQQNLVELAFAFGGQPQECGAFPGLPANAKHVPQVANMTLEPFAWPQTIQALRPNHQQRGVEHTAGTPAKSKTAQHLH